MNCFLLDDAFNHLRGGWGGGQGGFTEGNRWTWGAGELLVVL